MTIGETPDISNIETGYPTLETIEARSPGTGLDRCARAWLSQLSMDEF